MGHLHPGVRLTQANPRSGILPFGATNWTFPPEECITRLEVNDLNFELAFTEWLRQDESGEKGFEALEALDVDFVFHVERECPRSFPQK
jgi:hypothetical protein